MCKKSILGTIESKLTEKSSKWKKMILIKKTKILNQIIIEPIK